MTIVDRCEHVTFKHQVEYFTYPLDLKRQDPLGGGAKICPPPKGSPSVCHIQNRPIRSPPVHSATLLSGVKVRI